MNDEEFHKKMQQAKERVDKWPEWKKNILEESFKSKNDFPREPIDHSKTQAAKKNS